MIPSARSTSVNGLYLLKRAKDLARWLQRTRMVGKQEVIDGYLVKATRAGPVASGLVMDLPGSLVVFHRSTPGRSAGWGVYAAGTRDNYDNRLALPDGTYSAEDEPTISLKNLFWGFGFDPNEELPPTSPNPWEDAVVSAIDGSHLYRRDRLICSRLKAFPGESFKIGPANPTSGATAVFSEARVIGHVTASTPGFAFTSSWLMDLTGGYQANRNVAFDLSSGYTGPVYAGFEYQGDAPILTYHDGMALVVIPVVNNLETELAPGVVHWGHSAVLFLLYDIPGPAVEGSDENRPVLRWSRLWSPDEHSVDFFHNGPWLSYPSPAHSPPFIFPVIDGLWDDWWGAWSAADRPTPAGGSRPNWTDAISAAWHVDRFVVSLRCCAHNGTFHRVTPGGDDYWTAGGSAHVRFAITPTEESADFGVTEVEHEIWDAPERHQFADPADTPYARWVVGSLDTEAVHCSNPLCTFVDSGRLFEITWKMEGDRHELLFGHPTAIPATGRIEVVVTAPDVDTRVHTVNFQELGYGVVGPALSIEGEGVRLVSPTVSYKMRALESQFLLISRNELAFLARQTWYFSSNPPYEQAQLIVLDLETGVASRRSQVPVRMPNSLAHFNPAHMDCIQQTIFDDEGEVAVEGVLIVTGDEVTATAVISRDSGLTWADYVTGITDSTPQRAVYYIGNPLGGGATPGHAII